jgi:hypothetical protein
MNDFDALQYSACLAISILLFISIISILIHLIRKKPSFSCTKKSSNRLSSISHQLNLSRSYYTPEPDIYDLPPSYHYTDQNYEPPPYPGLPLFSSIHYSDSNYYETIKPSSMSMLNSISLPEQHVFTNIQTHCV